MNSRYRQQMILVFKDDGTAWIYLDGAIAWNSPAHRRITALLVAELLRREKAGIAEHSARVRTVEAVGNDLTDEEYAQTGSLAVAS